MKTIIAYYIRNGSNRKLAQAQELSEKLTVWTAWEFRVGLRVAFKRRKEVEQGSSLSRKIQADAILEVLVYSVWTRLQGGHSLHALRF